MARLSIARLSLNELMALRDNIDERLAEESKRINALLARMPGAEMPGRKTVKGTKVPPKYRSKQDSSVTWSGRGAIPRWMREEMKAGKLKKEAFLIK